MKDDSNPKKVIEDTEAKLKAENILQDPSDPKKAERLLTEFQLKYKEDVKSNKELNKKLDTVWEEFKAGSRDSATL